MTKKVLIVDDDEDNLSVLQLMFEFQGYAVFTDNIGTNSERVLFIEPDIIIMDLYLPILGGDEICSLLKKDERTAHIPVILLTTNQKFEEIAMRCKANASIGKPFDLDDMMQLVKKHIL